MGAYVVIGYWLEKFNKISKCAFSIVSSRLEIWIEGWSSQLGGWLALAGPLAGPLAGQPRLTCLLASWLALGLACWLTGELDRKIGSKNRIEKSD